MSEFKVEGAVQQNQYDAAYAASDLVPFPDHKVEGTLELVSKTIVSIGGGTGSDIAHLASKNTITILDYSAAAAKSAKHFGIDHKTIDLNALDLRLPFEDESGDILVVKDVLEHLLEPARVMIELKRVLKREGYMVISLPNHFTLWDRLRLVFGSNLVWRGILHDHSQEYDEWDYMHIRFFTWGGVKRFLKKSGLRIEQTFFDLGPFGHYFSIPMYAEHLRLKEKTVGPLTPKGQIFLRVGYPIYRIVSCVFPAPLRDLICKLSPGLFTSCFYLHAKKGS